MGPGRYRLEGEAKITEVPLHTSDKRVAQQHHEEMVKQGQQEADGKIPTGAKRTALQFPLLNHLKDYLSDLTATGRDQEYIYIVISRFKSCSKSANGQSCAM